MSKTKKRTELLYTLVMIGASAGWGFGFSIQAIGAKHVGPFTFLAFRNWISVVAMLPVILFVDRADAKKGLYTPTGRPFEMRGGTRRDLWFGGLITGLFTLACTGAQQIAVSYTTSAKIGFISAMYIVIVPLLSIFLKKRPAPRVWIGVGLAVAGLCLLCLKDRLRLQLGDLIVLCAAFLISFQVLAIDHYVTRTEVFRFTTVQFFFGGVFSTILMLILEKPSAAGIWKAMPSILYAALVASAIANTAQVVAQKYLSATIASLAMSTESVFSAIGGIAMLHQYLSARETLGCVLMFAAIIVAQIGLPGKKARAAA